MDNQVLEHPKEAIHTNRQQILRETCKKIAPLWSLENFVAVNPYLGHTDKTFDSTAHYLAAIAGIQMTLPISFYHKKIKEGIITQEDIQAALAKKSYPNVDLETFLNSLNQTESKAVLPAATISDSAFEATGMDWNRFAISRISTWAASYFDKGQASWNASNPDSSLFEAWKMEASIDLSTEIMGLKGFRKAVDELPQNPVEAMQKALDILDIQDDILPMYLHRLLLRLGGWAAYVARIDWENGIKGNQSETLIEFLSVLVCWEACLLRCLSDRTIQPVWFIAKKNLESINSQTDINLDISQKLILQEAFDIAKQREIIAKFQGNEVKEIPKKERPLAQAIFCIDVRSEVFRRNLEQVDEHIETLGFAGFFAFPTNFLPLAHNEGQDQCPVLIPSGLNILEEIPDSNSHETAYKHRIFKHQIKSIWKAFKSGAVSCFSFVSPMGLSYLPRLFTNSYGLTRPVPNPNQFGIKTTVQKQRSISLKEALHNGQKVGIPVEKRIQMAKNALNAMSLTENFGRFVLIVGHGSTTVNNPYASGLDCGACGGRSGEPNAKVAAAVLNDKEVRKHLVNENITIPDDTVFLACLHDTTTDEVSIFNEGDVPETKSEELENLKASLSKAGTSTRAERALRMDIGRNIDKEVIMRSKDWSQVRPEWGLAGCSTFVVASRQRSKNIDFKGQSFLHSYDWKKDDGFPVLELIMTAPMVVASWINLQYYASTVDNKHFGSGNKTLHNVTAGLGVLEGYSGDLRVGLPIQSVHDGEKFQHEPVRLNVIIEAPIEAMNSVLEKHPSVKDLCDNKWIFLFALNEQGRVSHQYSGQLQWDTL